MKEVYVIYNLFRPVTNTWVRIAETYRHASDPNIFNRLVTELEKLEAGNEDGWIGSYQFVSKELFENFLENTHEIGSIN